MEIYKDWIAEQVRRAGLRLISDFEEIRVAYTAVVLRVLTDSGHLYFKTAMSAFAFEAALTAALAEWFPQSIPAVIALDKERGWLLMRDAGVSMRALTRADGDFSRWDGMLREYAMLQQKTASHIEQLLTLGVPDRWLDKLPKLYDNIALSDTE